MKKLINELHDIFQFVYSCVLLYFPILKHFPIKLNINCPRIEKIHEKTPRVVAHTFDPNEDVWTICISKAVLEWITKYPEQYTGFLFGILFHEFGHLIACNLYKICDKDIEINQYYADKIVTDIMKIPLVYRDLDAKMKLHKIEYVDPEDIVDILPLS